jgi:hypothetical protein
LLDSFEQAQKFAFYLLIIYARLHKRLEHITLSPKINERLEQYDSMLWAA